MAAAGRCLIRHGRAGRVCSTCFHLCGFIWCECMVGKAKVLPFPSCSPVLLAKQCGLHMTNQICQTASVFPPHVQQKIWLQLLLHPKGNFQNSSPPHLSEMKLSRFLWSSEICLLISNHTRFHGMYDQDKCLECLFMSLQMTLQSSMLCGTGV